MLAFDFNIGCSELLKITEAVDNIDNIDNVVRLGELRKAEWSEFNFDKSEWLILASKMKMKADHVVPLSDQPL